MDVNILNSDGLTLSSVVDFLPVYEYELFGEIPDIDGRWGVLLDIDVLLEDAGVIDDTGTRLVTPCPSRSKEWSRAVDLAMKDLKMQVCSHPERVWLPGSVRPFICENEETNDYYFACCCPDCNTDKEMESIQEFQGIIEDYDKQEIGEILADNKDMQALTKKKDKMSSGFDKAMKQAVHRHFPEAEVIFSNPLRGGYISGTFHPGKDYSVHPSMIEPGFQGKLLLRSLEDFQLAAILFEDVSGALLQLPSVVEEEHDFEDSELVILAAELFGARQDIRYTAERFLNTIFAGGETIAL